MPPEATSESDYHVLGIKPGGGIKQHATKNGI
jgi:hypothetical protein